MPAAPETQAPSEQPPPVEETPTPEQWPEPDQTPAPQQQSLPELADVPEHPPPREQPPPPEAPQVQAPGMQAPAPAPRKAASKSGEPARLQLYGTFIQRAEIRVGAQQARPAPVGPPPPSVVAEAASCMAMPQVEERVGGALHPVPAEGKVVSGPGGPPSPLLERLRLVERERRQLERERRELLAKVTMLTSVAGQALELVSGPLPLQLVQQAMAVQVLPEVAPDLDRQEQQGQGQQRAPERRRPSSGGAAVEGRRAQGSGSGGKAKTPSGQARPAAGVRRRQQGLQAGLPPEGEQGGPDRRPAKRQRGGCPQPGSPPASEQREQQQQQQLGLPLEEQRQQEEHQRLSREQQQQQQPGQLQCTGAPSEEAPSRRRSDSRSAGTGTTPDPPLPPPYPGGCGQGRPQSPGSGGGGGTGGGSDRPSSCTPSPCVPQSELPPAGCARLISYQDWRQHKERREALTRQLQRSGSLSAGGRAASAGPAGSAGQPAQQGSSARPPGRHRGGWAVAWHTGVVSNWAALKVGGAPPGITCLSWAWSPGFGLEGWVGWSARGHIVWPARSHRLRRAGGADAAAAGAEGGAAAAYDALIQARLWHVCRARWGKEGPLRGRVRGRGGQQQGRR